ncbi:MAG TPA: tetratricopeptide repeat protein [Pyrinomonadaceae bacterium]|nr:tetratricopeptide repeat protein [Pyrinomonadaceae bacterium]
MGIEPSGFGSPDAGTGEHMPIGSKSTRIATSFLIAALLIANAAPLYSQDFVQVSDITGGSSVFVVRSSSRAARKYTPQKSTRSIAQKKESAKRIRTQLNTIAKTTPKTDRAAVVAPDKLPANIKTMAPAKASLLFAGVGEYYIDRDDLENSINFFRESVELDTKNEKANKGLSAALAAKGNDLMVKDQPQGARAFFLEALKFDPKNAAAYFGLGEVFSEQDKQDEAVANFEMALKSNANLTEIYVPLGILYFQKGEIAKADDLLSKALAASPNDAETQLFVGMIRSSQNRNAEALAAFEKARTLDPTNAEASFNVGEVLVRLDRTKDAIAEYEKAIALRPNYFEAHFSLGEAHLSLKNYDLAIKSLREAKRLKNDNLDVVIALGDAQRMAGLYGDAIGSYNLATAFIARRPDFSKDSAADVYSNLGLSIGQQCTINMKKAIACEWPAAIKALEKAVELGGGKTADFSNLGWAYYNAARVDGYDKREAEKRTKLELARVNLDKAVSMNPTFIAGPLMNLGMVLTDLGEYANAANALTKAVEKEPKWVFAMNELGIAFRKQDKYKEAISWFKKAIDQDDNFVAAHFNLAESEIKNGNMGNAKKSYEKLKKMGQNSYAVQLELMTNGAIKK